MKQPDKVPLFEIFLSKSYCYLEGFHGGHLELFYTKMKVFFSKKKDILLFHIAAVTSQIPCWNCLIRYDVVFIKKRVLKRACPGVGPGTSRTLSENHATRPTGQT